MAPSKDRVGEYHKTFARQIIRQLEEGTAPFQKPWKPGERSLPENLATGRRYAGGNSLYLSVAAQTRGYTDNRWATYRQIREAGGHVERGERATQILFFSTTKLVPAKDDQGNPKLNDAGEPVYTVLERPKPFVRTYSVFNAEQTGGLPERPPATAPPEWEGHAAADAIIETSGVTVKHQAGDRAYYNVRTDEVVLPEPGQFPSTGSYYQTAIHELGHATGHPDRLNRDTLGKKFGSPEYAREELRAEIAAMMTGEKIGLGHQPQNDSAAYVASWVKALEDDPREIYRAAADAERISRYLIEPARERIEQREQQPPQQPAADAEDRQPGPELERREELDPTQALQAAAAQQQAATRFNGNISRAADAALGVLRRNGNEDRPTEKLIRDLQAVHLVASQNAYTPKTADFRGLRGDLQNHAIDAQSLSSDERKAVLSVADSFANQAQGHAVHDPAIAEQAHGRDDGPTRG
ncbi:MAG: zincin-like metallopeptidase domain-containing protein [Acidobacteria bacterium]|nr:zincin-like metallopeptidase domain-containing protein [Acidobacteriota bacterium]MCY3971603.1 zincin-like metallopeptidase domain-containing protein [Acidobacteriota bacterium]